ncbi:MAG: hypothetical protein JRF40_07530, partial [Deltaproteobacteria bacterium]|nr:hypothetical protein [Deltaproteobacteria bacterium]
MSEEVYRDALTSMAETGEGLVKAFVDRQVVSEYQLLEAMSVKYGIPFLPELPITNARQELFSEVSIQFLKKNVMVPLEYGENVTGLDSIQAEEKKD